MLVCFIGLLMVYLFMPLSCEKCTCCNTTNKENLDHNNEPLQLKVNPAEQVTEHKKKRCCPYNFDGKSCRYIGDRLLCGYNKNLGMYENDKEINVGNNCRIRKGRIECGYVNPPFTNFRRPPPEDYDIDKSIDRDSSNAIDIDKSDKDKDSLRKPIARRRKDSQAQVYNSRREIRCVEIDGNIVCRKLR